MFFCLLSLISFSSLCKRLARIRVEGEGVGAVFAQAKVAGAGDHGRVVGAKHGVGCDKAQTLARAHRLHLGLEAAVRRHASRHAQRSDARNPPARRIFSTSTSTIAA